MHKLLPLSFCVNDTSRFNRLIKLLHSSQNIAKAALIGITAPLQNALHVISAPPKLIPVTRKQRLDHPHDSR